MLQLERFVRILEVNQLEKKVKVLSVTLESSFVGRFQFVWKIGEKSQGFVSFFRFVIVHIYVLCTNFAFLCKCTLDVMCN